MRMGAAKPRMLQYPTPKRGGVVVSSFLVDDEKRTVTVLSQVVWKGQVVGDDEAAVEDAMVEWTSKQLRQQATKRYNKKKREAPTEQQHTAHTIKKTRLPELYLSFSPIQKIVSFGNPGPISATERRARLKGSQAGQAAPTPQAHRSSAQPSFEEYRQTLSARASYNTSTSRSTQGKTTKR